MKNIPKPCIDIIVDSKRREFCGKEMLNVMKNMIFFWKEKEKAVKCIIKNHFKNENFRFIPRNKIEYSSQLIFLLSKNIGINLLEKVKNFKWLFTSN